MPRASGSIGRTFCQSFAEYKDMGLGELMLPRREKAGDPPRLGAQDGPRLGLAEAEAEASHEHVVLYNRLLQQQGACLGAASEVEGGKVGCPPAPSPDSSVCSEQAVA